MHVRAAIKQKGREHSREGDCVCGRSGTPSHTQDWPPTPSVPLPPHPTPPHPRHSHSEVQSWHGGCENPLSSNRPLTPNPSHPRPAPDTFIQMFNHDSPAQVATPSRPGCAAATPAPELPGPFLLLLLLLLPPLLLLLLLLPGWCCSVRSTTGPATSTTPTSPPQCLAHHTLWSSTTNCCRRDCWGGRQQHSTCLG